VFFVGNNRKEAIFVIELLSFHNLAGLEMCDCGFESKNMKSVQKTPIPKLMCQSLHVNLLSLIKENLIGLKIKIKTDLVLSLLTN